MSESRSQAIIILLAGIFFVLLVGREAALTTLNWGFWVVLALAVLALIVAAAVAFLNASRREMTAFCEDLVRLRKQGAPWLYLLISLVGGAGLLPVVGLSCLHYFNRTCRNVMTDCLKTVPFWDVPVYILWASIPVLFAEKIFPILRKARTSGQSEE